MPMYANETPRAPEGEICSEPSRAIRMIVSDMNKALCETNETLNDIMKMIAGGEPKGNDKHEIGCLFDELCDTREQAFVAREKALVIREMLFG